MIFCSLDSANKAMPVVILVTADNEGSSTTIRMTKDMAEFFVTQLAHVVAQAKDDDEDE